MNKNDEQIAIASLTAAALCRFLPKSTARWIKTKRNRASKDAIQFLPLPKGEGRGEGEGKVFRPHALKPQVILSICLLAAGCATTLTHESAVVKSEFIFETAPFRSCHASTIAETKS
jgi:hypothetical protein